METKTEYENQFQQTKAKGISTRVARPNARRKIPGDVCLCATSIQLVIIGENINSEL